MIKRQKYSFWGNRFPSFAVYTSMKSTILYLVIIIGISAMLTSACTKAGTGFNTYDLDYEQQVSIDADNRIRFTQVIEDSRCPIDVECVWAGRAVVGFEFSAGSETTFPITLALGPDNPEAADTTVLDKYRLELLRVLPAPLSTADPLPEEYQVRILVEEL